MPTFAQAVQSSQLLKSHFASGIQALSKSEAKKLQVGPKVKFVGSVNVDAACKATMPNDNRWDYAVATKGKSEFVHWIEFHDATEKEAAVVIKKLDWLRMWLKTNPLANFRADFLWISTGKVHLTQRSKSLKVLAAKGCKFCGRHVTFRQ